MNHPGSMHDTVVAAKLIETVVMFTGIFKMCVDQGVLRSGLLFDKFVGPIPEAAAKLDARVQ